MTKVCSVPGCNKKHHAKGYCKGHYKWLYFAPILHGSDVCSVEGCTAPISPNYTGLKLCEKHGTRYRRYGNTEVRQRERDIKSIIETLIKSDSPLDCEIPNRNSFSEITRLYYGNYCHKCGWSAGNCEAHHIIPKSDGGKNTIRNAVILCPNCHSLEHKNQQKRFSKITNQELIELLNRIKV